MKIGLLVNADTSADAGARQAVHVVEMVLDRVNAGGGIRGKPVEAVVKSVDGNWGSGSTRSVDLIYEEGVVALLGFVDGRSAHLIEQICTKAEVPFVSTYSPDPTLSRIPIPWYFSTMPTATRQAAALAAEIFEHQQKRRVAVISTGDYDMRVLARSFVQEVKRRSFPAPAMVTYQPGKESTVDTVASTLRDSEPEGIVFLGNREQWAVLVSQLSAQAGITSVFLPVMEWVGSDSDNYPFPVYAVAPEGWHSDDGTVFREVFFNRFGYRPSIAAFYLYDGTTALLKAIDKRGPLASEIKKGLNQLEFGGISGTIAFGDNGEIEQEPSVIRIQATNNAQ
ncbi:MAG: ABC transporter substrate-binding protein [Balneolaceae bacterium]|nr:ABC transporter substrate-binding protein [Balneolaceae bacterium]